MATSAYLINPSTGAITTVELNGGLQEIYALLGCRCVDAVRIANGDAIYVDDEGMFDRAEDAKYFVVDPDGENFTLICGRGLWVGTSPQGDTISPITPVDDLHNYIRVVEDDNLGDVADVLAGGSMVATNPAEYQKMVDRHLDIQRKIFDLYTRRFSVS